MISSGWSLTLVDVVSYVDLNGSSPSWRKRWRDASRFGEELIGWRSGARVWRAMVAEMAPLEDRARATALLALSHPITDSLWWRGCHNDRPRDLVLRDGGTSVLVLLDRCTLNKEKHCQ